MGKTKLLGLLGVLSFIFVTAGNALAIPTLQLYIEGATYNLGTETWVTTSPSFKLWVLGDVGHDGSISDVRLSYAYDSSESGFVTFTPTTASSLTDPSIPSAPSSLASGSSGTPIMGDGNPLPPHSPYGSGVSWVSYQLGDFTLTDSPIGDYTSGECPDGSCSYPDSGQINAYTVDVTGYSWVHFDAFDHIIVGKNNAQYRFAPFSHDAEGGGSPIPEPGTLSLLGLGLLGVLGFRKRK